MNEEIVSPAERAQRIYTVVRTLRNDMTVKPIRGGALDGFELAHLAETDRFLVVDHQSRLPLSCASTKARALADARETAELSAFKSILAEFRSLHSRDVRRADPAARSQQIPKRRRQVFAKSAGKCHYCATPLTIDGKWHIEHMMPKALLGDDGMANLVASCVSCNHKKRDMTAEEFISKQTMKESA